MTKRIFLLIVFSCFLTVIIFAQNLVPNPGFEPFSADSFFWINPANTSPDYSTIDEPGWWRQYEHITPHGGKGFYHLDFKSTNHEYVETILSTKLKKNSVYCISLYVSLMNTSLYAIEFVGAALTKSKLKGKASDFLKQKEGIAFLNSNHYLTKMDSWIKICTEFKAKGGEEYLTIGTFDELTFVGLDNMDTVIEARDMRSSYFIDDISLIEIDDNNKCICQSISSTGEPIPSEKDIPALNINIEQGQKLIIDKIYFQVDKAELVDSSFTELDRWVKYLNAHSSLKIEIGGHTDNSGSENHNKVLSEGRAKSVYDYLVSKGINRERLNFVGYGSNFPIESNSTIAGMQKNRRVEFKILEK